MRCELSERGHALMGGAPAEIEFDAIVALKYEI